ncbi:MAG TPA: helix-turn-helix domain-containing protein [Solirubrobacteraceae bacterium]|jgi:excisionase family DNA binding protein
MSHTEPDETYLTVAEVAETLKLNQQTVRNWIDQGALPALRVGRRVRIKRSDFERILEESYSAGTAASSRRLGPSADDFWGGEPVGVAEPGPGRSEAEAASGAGLRPAQDGAGGGPGAEGGG